MSKTGKRLSIIVAALALIALMSGVWLQRNQALSSKDYEKSLLTATVLPTPRHLSSFELTDINKQIFTNQNLKGHWSMVFFGFTNCPMLCPTTLSVLNYVYKKMEGDHLPSLPQILFVSVDPERDSPEKIKKYLRGFNKHFFGATGTKKQLEELTQEMSVMYMKVQTPEDKKHGTYSIDHSGAILVLSPKGELYAIFSTPHNIDTITHDFELIQAHYTS